jgi:glycerol-3-phosphate dehydrogenase (NAD(P)+)
MNKQKILVLGDGAWATTLAIILSNNKQDVSMYSVFPDYLDELDKNRVNKKYLPDVSIPKDIKFEKDINEGVLNADIIIDAIPSKFYRSVLKNISCDVSGKIFVNVSKGIEEDSLKRMTEIIHEELSGVKTCVLSGPTIAIEVAQEMPAVIVAASEDEGVAKTIQDIFFNEYFRVYTSSDTIGVELGGPLKNIIAIVAGISDGLGFGANTKAAILARGLIEIERFCTELGGKSKTVYGIAGLGDLSTTCISSEKLGKGEKMDDILNSTNSIVEGATTTKAVYELSQKLGVDMPFTKQVYLILYKNKEPKQALIDLMQRSKKEE